MVLSGPGFTEDAEPVAVSELRDGLLGVATVA
jgi:hypothetical protein